MVAAPTKPTAVPVAELMEALTVSVAAAAGNVTNEILFSEYKKAERGLFKNFDCYV